ncbi:hypothetical protein Neosp_008184 [[Neocosmospora] mangrovei]
MATDSTSTDISRVNGDSGSTDHSSMLLPFIYDMTSFSDRQVQIANGGATTPSTKGPPSPIKADGSSHKKKKKDDKLVGK